MGSHAPNLALFIDADPLRSAHVSDKLMPHSSKSVTACKPAVNHSKIRESQKKYSPFFGQERAFVNFSNRFLTSFGPGEQKHQQSDKDIYYLSGAIQAFLDLKMSMVFL